MDRSVLVLLIPGLVGICVPLLSLLPVVHDPDLLRQRLLELLLRLLLLRLRGRRFFGTSGPTRTEGSVAPN